MFFNRALKYAERTLRNARVVEYDLIKLSDDDLRAKILELRRSIVRDEFFDFTTIGYKTGIATVIATIVECIYRIHKERAYDVQIKSAILLNIGKNIELSTGQGKTLTTTLAALSRCFFTKYIHVIIVNDYLTKRDFDYTNAVAQFMGFEVGYIISTSNDDERQKGYLRDITYLTYHEICFDYMRENTRFDKRRCLLHDHIFNTHIVDESDQIYLDSVAQVISTKLRTANPEKFMIADKIVRQLDASFFNIRHESFSYSIKDEKYAELEMLICTAFDIMLEDIRTTPDINIWFYINNAIKAHHLYEYGKQYIVINDMIALIDGLTGRIAYGREYSDGLGQAMQAKEGLKISNESLTTNFVNLQSVFMHYRHKSGMSGTTVAVKEEIKAVFKMDTIRVLNDKQKLLTDYGTIYFIDKKSKYKYIIDLVTTINKTGQPILIGNGEIRETEELYKMLADNGISSNVLNAKYNEVEAALIKEAGSIGAVTIATNMAGRGTDIKPGGLKTDDTDDYERRRKRVLDLGGIYVIAMSPGSNKRIDEQLKGRTARNEDKGMYIRLVSFEDEIFRKINPSRASSLKQFFEKYNGEKSFILDHLVSRAQNAIEVRDFEGRISQISFESYISQNKNFYYKLRRNVLHDKLDYYTSLNNFIDRSIIENKVSMDLVMRILSINNSIEYSEIYDMDNETLGRIVKEKIKSLGREFFSNRSVSDKEKIKNAVLIKLDELWVDFVSSIGLIRKTNTFRHRIIDSNLELSMRTTKMFNYIFKNFYNSYLSIILKL